MIVHHVKDLEPGDAGVVDAIPVTSPTRTLIDLAAVLSADTLEEALDDALRRGLTTTARLRWRIDGLGRRGRSGVGVLSELIQERSTASASSESVLETRFVRLLRRARLPLPVPQFEIRDGRRRLRVDFAYPDLRLAIEIDGYRWHSGRSRWENDLARGNILMRLRWAVLRFTSRDIERRPEVVCTMIAEARRDRIQDA